MTDPDLPVLDFATFVLSLSHSALMYLGEAPHPDSSKIVANLPMAKQTIDLIGMIEEKTKGNLTDEESKLLTQAVHELRLSYLQLSKQVAEHLKKQAQAGVKPGGKGPGIVPG